MQPLVPQLLHVAVGEAKQPLSSVSAGLGGPANRQISSNCPHALEHERGGGQTGHFNFRTEQVVLKVLLLCICCHTCDVERFIGGHVT